MDQILFTDLTTLSKNLNDLLTSLETSTPSLPAAHALLASEAHLHTNLQLLQDHHANQTRIRDLRSLIATQEAQIAHGLENLSTVRDELRAIPPAPAPAQSNGQNRPSVNLNELLDYAALIADRAPPPGYQLPSVVTDSTTNEVNDTGENTALSSLQQDEKRWLDPLAGAGAGAGAGVGGGWVPWPTEDVIRQSALARTDAEGQDGADVKMEMEMEADAEPEPEPTQKQKQKPEPIPRDEVKEKEKEKPRVFGGLDLYDPDEE